MLHVSGQLPTCYVLSVCLFCTVNNGSVEHFLTTRNHMECRKRQETQRGLRETLSLFLAQERAVPQNLFSIACPSPFSPLLVVVQPPRAAQRMTGSSCCFLLRFTAADKLGDWSSETSCHQDALPNVTVAVTSVTTTWSNFLVLSIQRGWIQTQSRSEAGGFIFVFAAKSSSGVRAFLRLHRRRLLRICLFVGG